MPVSLVRRINLDLLYPEFRDRCLDLLADAQDHGLTFVATEGFRSFERSQALYVTYKRGGPRAAPPGLSAHNYGMAIDVMAFDKNKQGTWLPEAYEPLRELCVKHKLAWGGLFKDMPHIGHPDFVTGAQLTPLAKLWGQIVGGSLTEKLQSLWAQL